jgi:small subunit ribosomal protein S4
LAPTRMAARQLVGHRHITVNGKVVNIASYTCKTGDVVAVRERSKSLEVIATAGGGSKHAWLEWDRNTMTGKILNLPTRDQIQEPIKEQLIVELYSK